jgi:hypothetical protein
LRKLVLSGYLGDPRYKAAGGVQESLGRDVRTSLKKGK